MFRHLHVMWSITALTGCLSGPTFLTQHGSTADAGAISVPVSTASGGVVTAQISASSGVAQKVAASSASAVAGSSVTFPPGALAISTSITIQEGTTLASSTLATQLGLSSSNSITPASTAIVITSGSPTDAATPFTIALPLSSSATSLLDTVNNSNLVIVYTVLDATNSKNLAGIIPNSALSISGGSIIFSTTHFGQFQAAYTLQPVTTSISVPTTTQILTTAAAATLAPVVWQSVSASYTAGQLQVTASATGFTTLTGCVASIAPNGTTTAFFNGPIGTSTNGTVTVPAPAYGSYQVQLGCSETNGRLSTSPWSAAFTMGTPAVAPAPAPAPALPPPVVLLSNLPSPYANLSTLNVTVSGTNLAQYQAAVTNQSNSCSGATYSNWTAANVPITIALSADGAKTLCVLGRSSTGVVAPAPTIYSWVKLTAHPSLVNTFPGNGNSGIEVAGLNLSAVFSSPLQPPTCNPIGLYPGTTVPSGTTVSAAPNAGGVCPAIVAPAVAGAQSFGSPNTLGFTPAAALALNAPYTVQLASNIADLAGNIDGTIAPWTFMTADGSWQETSPSINLSTPLPPENLSPSGQSTVVASNQSNTTVVVYIGYTSGSPTGVFATQLAAGANNWTGVARLDNPNYQVDQPKSISAAVDPSGNILVLWTQSDVGGVLNGSSLFASYFNVSRGAWISSTVQYIQYTNGSQLGGAAVAADSVGAFHVAWFQNTVPGGVSTPVVVMAVYNGASWSAAAALSSTAAQAGSLPPNYLQVRVDPRGDALVAWIPFPQSPSIINFYTSYLGVSGTAVLATENDTGSYPSAISTNPLLAIDNNGNSLVVWGDTNNSTSTSTLRSNYLAAGTVAWHNTDIADLAASISYQNLAMAANAIGYARVVWWDSSGGIQSRVFNSGQLAVGTQVLQTGTEPSTLLVAMDQYGDTAVAWGASSGVSATAMVPNLQSTPDISFISGTYVYNLSLTMDPAGNAMLVGITNGSAAQIYQSRLGAGESIWPTFSSPGPFASPVGDSSFTLVGAPVASQTGTMGLLWGSASNFNLNMIPFK